MQGQIEVVRLFCKDLSRELTIRQISKLIKKSYAYTNGEVWKLIESSILIHREIGKSVVCTINIKNPNARLLLIFNSMLEAKEQLKEKQSEIAADLKGKDAYCAFISKNRLHVVCRDKNLLKSLKADLLSASEFISYVREKGLDSIVVFGSEFYWEKVGEINA